MARPRPAILSPARPGALPEIWALGLRSPEGLAFDPATGLLWESELGPRGGDEINIIKKGANYGWPVITHGMDYPGVPIGDGITAKEGMEQPVYYWDPASDPAGIAFYRGNLFPQWKNSLFVAMMNGKFLDRLTIVQQQGRGGGTAAGGHEYPLPGCAGRARWRGLCFDRQRHGQYQPQHAADQQAAEADAPITVPTAFLGRASTVGEVRFALSDLDNIAVRITDVAARLAVFVLRFRDELGASAFP